MRAMRNLSILMLLAVFCIALSDAASHYHRRELFVMRTGKYLRPPSTYMYMYVQMCIYIYVTEGGTHCMYMYVMEGGTHCMFM